MNWSVCPHLDRARHAIYPRAELSITLRHHGSLSYFIILTMIVSFGHVRWLEERRRAARSLRFPSPLQELRRLRERFGRGAWHLTIVSRLSSLRFGSFLTGEQTA
jgi:hypothetical protein